jgi:hypothetical protein
VTDPAPNRHHPKKYVGYLRCHLSAPLYRQEAMPGWSTGRSAGRGCPAAFCRWWRRSIGRSIAPLRARPTRSFASIRHGSARTIAARTRRRAWISQLNEKPCPSRVRLLRPVAVGRLGVPLGFCSGGGLYQPVARPLIPVVGLGPPIIQWTGGWSLFASVVALCAWCSAWRLAALIHFFNRLSPEERIRARGRNCHRIRSRVRGGSRHHFLHHAWVGVSASAC